MILELYSIYDKKLGEFLPPFCCKNEEDAIRMCSNLVNHSDSLMLKFPEDYDCNLVGKFDTEQGSIENCTLQDLANLSRPSIEFKNLVKDETKKYNDVLHSIEVEKGRLDCLADKLSNNVVTVEQLILTYKKKLDDIDKSNTSHLDDGLSTHISQHEIDLCEKSVDTPDFLPTNNTKSQQSFLDKLFS